MYQYETKTVEEKTKNKEQNKTGIPTPLKQNFEAMSSLSFDDVRIHYNSDKPAKLQALAYTQGNQVYIGSGQEKHLAHELSHVVQQKQGRVSPTTQVKGININDNEQMENEADVMSQQAAKGPSLYSSRHYTAPPLNTVQLLKDKKDVYKGGAELECRNAIKHTLNFDLNDIDPAIDKAELKKNLRAGIKGISFAKLTYGQDSVKKAMKGNNWNLTVETNMDTAIDESNNIDVELELIIGGPQGSTLSDLKTASSDAAANVAALENKGILDFVPDVDEEAVMEAEPQIGEVIRDNVKKKFEKKKSVGDTTLDEEIAKVTGQDWSSIKLKCDWEPMANFANCAWGAQITLGVPLEEIGKVSSALVSKGLNDTAKAMPSLSGDVVWSSHDILDEWKKGGFAPFAGDYGYRPPVEPDVKRLFSEKYGAAYNDADPKCFNKMGLIYDEVGLTEKKHFVDSHVGKLTGPEEKDHFIAVLDGLAKVLAAYSRAINNSPAHGPKHDMKFVTKNPLPLVIKNAASSLTDGYKDALLNACVNLIESKSPNAVFRWVGAELSIAAWAAEMKVNKIDLIAQYDAQYRSAQIGGLSALNDVTLDEGEAADKKYAPVIEYRDLGAKKPSEMEKVFDAIIDKLNT